MSTPALLTLFLSHPAAASVLVGTFEGEGPAAEAVAAALVVQLEERLGSDPSLGLVRRESVPDMSGARVTSYLDSCPPGEAAGCTCVVAEFANVKWAVSGSVRVEGDAIFLETTFHEVESKEAVATVALRLEPGDQERFTARVAKTLRKIEEGDVEPSPSDIRVSAPVVDPAEEARRREAAIADLVRAEFEDLTGSSRESARVKQYQEEEIDRADAGPLDTPWDDEGMSAEDWKDMRSRGLEPGEWKRKSRGRRGLVFVRPGVGLAWAPSTGSYFAQNLLDPSTMEPVETWAWQTQEPGAGLTTSLGVGVGIGRSLEIDASAAYFWGRYRSVFQEEFAGSEVEPIQVEEEAPSGSFLASVGVRVAPGSFRMVRPLGAVGVCYWRGNDATRYSKTTFESFPTFPDPHLLGIRLAGGVEASLSPRVDLYGQIPLIAFVGNPTETSGDPSETAMDVRPAPQFVPFGAGVEFGIQLRLGVEGGGGATAR